MAKARRWANPTVFPRSNDAPPGCHSAGVRERPETHLGLDVAAENEDTGPRGGCSSERRPPNSAAPALDWSPLAQAPRTCCSPSRSPHPGPRKRGLQGGDEDRPWCHSGREPAAARPRAFRDPAPTGDVDRRRVRWGRSIRFQPGAGSDSSRHSDTASRDAGVGSARAAEGAGRDEAPSRPALQGETRKEEGGRTHQSGGEEAVGEAGGEEAVGEAGGEEAVGEAGGDLPAESAPREPGRAGEWSRFGLEPVRQRHPADRVPSAPRGRVARLGRLAHAALSVVGMAVQTSVLLGGLRGSRRRANRAPITAEGPQETRRFARRLCRRRSGEPREACGSGQAYWYVNRRDPVRVTSSR